MIGRVAKTKRIKRGEIHAKTVLVCLATEVIVGSVSLKKRSQREVEAGQGQGRGIEIGQGIGGSMIGALVGKGKKGVEVGQGKGGEAEVGQGKGGIVEVGHGIGGEVEVGQGGGIVVGVVTNTRMMKRNRHVALWTLKVANPSPRKGEGQGHIQTVRIDQRASTKSLEGIAQGVPLKKPDPAVTKSLVAVRSRDTGLTPAQGGKTSS